MPALASASDSVASQADEVNWSKERQFWSFRPSVAQPLPGVKNKRWPQQPLDYFFLARLEQNQLTPSVQASKRTLIRRVSFDLTGLPPTPEEVRAFLTMAWRGCLPAHAWSIANPTGRPRRQTRRPPTCLPPRCISSKTTTTPRTCRCSSAGFRSQGPGLPGSVALRASAFRRQWPQQFRLTMNAAFRSAGRWRQFVQLLPQSGHAVMEFQRASQPDDEAACSRLKPALPQQQRHGDARAA